MFCLPHTKLGNRRRRIGVLGVGVGNEVSGRARDAVTHHCRPIGVVVVVVVAIPHCCGRGR